MFFWKSAKRARTPVSRSVAPLRAVAASRAEFSPLPQPDSCKRRAATIRLTRARSMSLLITSTCLERSVSAFTSRMDSKLCCRKNAARPPTAAISTAKNAITHSSIVPTRASRRRSLRLTLARARLSSYRPCRASHQIRDSLPSSSPSFRNNSDQKRPARDGQAVGPERRAPRSGRGVIRGMSGLGGPALAHGLGRRRGHRYRDRLHLGRRRGEPAPDCLPEAAPVPATSDAPKVPAEYWCCPRGAAGGHQGRTATALPCGCSRPGQR